MRTAVSFLFLLVPAFAAAQISVSGYLGGAATHPSDLRIERGGTNLLLQDVQYSGRSFEGPLYYGFRAGYFFHPSIGIQAEFIHLKLFAEADRPATVQGVVDGTQVNAVVPLNRYVQRFSISHGLNMVLGNVVYRHHVLRQPNERLGRVMLSGRLGFGGTVPHPESTVFGQSYEQYQIGGFAWQLGAGVEYRLWRGVYTLTEYKYTRTNQNLDIAGGKVRGRFQSHHGVFGLSLNF